MAVTSHSRSVETDLVENFVEEDHVCSVHDLHVRSACMLQDALVPGVESSIPTFDVEISVGP